MFCLLCPDINVRANEWENKIINVRANEWENKIINVRAIEWENKIINIRAIELYFDIQFAILQLSPSNLINMNCNPLSYFLIIIKNNEAKMSFIKVYVHFVWSTKNREPILTEGIRKRVFEHIRENARTKNIFVDFINGYSDHVHCLISLNDDLSIGKIAQLIKGESSHWINKNQLTKTRFQWQDEYLAIGVGEDKIPVVRDYIANQEKHHSNLSFSQEYDNFINKYGFDVAHRIQ